MSDSRSDLVSSPPNVPFEFFCLVLSGVALQVDWYPPVLPHRNCVVDFYRSFLPLCLKVQGFLLLIFYLVDGIAQRPPRQEGVSGSMSSLPSINLYINLFFLMSRRVLRSAARAGDDPPTRPSGSAFLSPAGNREEEYVEMLNLSLRPLFLLPENYLEVAGGRNARCIQNPRW